MSMSMLWLWLSLGFSGAAAQAVNEVGLSLSKASKVSQSASAHAEIAKLSSDLKMKQQQYSAAKLKANQLLKEEQSLSQRADQLERQESRMEERLKVDGSLSVKAKQARAQAQALQKKMLSNEAAVTSMQKAIRSQQDALRSSEEQLEHVKRREEDFSNGARLAVVKSNKLDQSLKEARFELRKQQENLTQQQEASRAAEVRRERAHADAQREEAQNVERSAWLEAHQGQVKPINVHSINLAEQEVADAENQLKQAQQKTQEQAAADAHALSEMRQRLEQSKLATAEAITKATEELRTEQEAEKVSLASAGKRVRTTPADAAAAERTVEAKVLLESLHVELADEQQKLHQQQLTNQAVKKEISRKKQQLTEAEKRHRSTIKSEDDRESRSIKSLKSDAQQQYKRDRHSEEHLADTVQKVHTDVEREEAQEHEVASEIQRAKKRLQQADLKLKQVEKQQTKARQDYNHKMYEYEQQKYQANVKAEENAEDEVRSLQEQFHELHRSKSAKITQLNHHLEDVRNAARTLRGA